MADAAVSVRPMAARQPTVGRRWSIHLAVGAVAAIAGLAYGWAITSDPLEPYYAAAVRSMSTSWHDFLFGAVDPAATVTLDKLPGAFWVQALFARAFGVHTWTLVLPQVLEGVLTVLVLFRAVRRLAGPGAGLVSAIVLAASPATVALDRGNISDSLMILLLVLAADAVSAALERGSQPRLILAGVWVGLAFQAKMIEAWLLLPAFGVAYLLAAPGSVARRVRHVMLAGLVTGAVSLLWMAAVTVVPASARPYVDGSSHDSVFDQVFVYNGLGRFGDQNPIQVLAGQGLSLGQDVPPPGWSRLLTGELGHDTGWLLPSALAVMVIGILARRGRTRTDPVRAGYLLWGAWLVTLVVMFSVASAIHAYYTAALSPAVGALCGIGLAQAWVARDRRAGALAAPAVLTAGATGYAAWLLARVASAPSWLLPTVAVAGAAAVLLAALALLVRRARTVRAGRLGTAALGALLVAALCAPVAASARLVTHRLGAFDTPFESARRAAAIRELFVQAPESAASSLPALERVRAGAPDLMAVQTSVIASVFLYASGQEVLPIGGFTGTIPAPSLVQLQDDIARGRFHLVLALTTTDPRLAWIAQHCRHGQESSAALLRSYYCVPSDVPPQR